MKITKTAILVGLLISWAFLVVLFIAGFSLIQNNPVGSSLSSSQEGLTDNNAQSVSVALTTEEVSKHNSLSDCWMIINNKVYELTPYVNSHPGGNAGLSQGCGKDATAVYNTKGGKKSGHSSVANSLLDVYFIGNLNQNISSSEFRNKISTIQNTTQPRTGDYEDDSEDEDEYEDD